MRDHAKKTNITVFDFYSKDATVVQGLRNDFWQITKIFESKNWSVEDEDFEQDSGISETHVFLYETKLKKKKIDFFLNYGRHQ